jgi:hypothetical protein
LVKKGRIRIRIRNNYYDDLSFSKSSRSNRIRVHNTGPPYITFGRPELLKIIGCVLQLAGQGRKPVPGNQLHPFRVQGQAKVPNQLITSEH